MCSNCAGTFDSSQQEPEGGELLTVQRIGWCRWDSTSKLQLSRKTRKYSVSCSLRVFYIGVGISTGATIWYDHNILAPIRYYCDSLYFTIQQVLWFNSAVHCDSFLPYRLLSFVYWESLQPSWRSKFVLDSNFVANFHCDAWEEQGFVCILVDLRGNVMYQNQI